ncbi:hypothetical protein, partial [Burkholderia stabilis]
IGARHAADRAAPPRAGHGEFVIATRPAPAPAQAHASATHAGPTTHTVSIFTAAQCGRFRFQLPIRIRQRFTPKKPE